MNLKTLLLYGLIRYCCTSLNNKIMAEFFNGFGASITRPTPIDQEVVWDKSQTIMSSTDRFGNITNVNQAFVDVSEYDAVELIGKPHNIIRHPDMPKIVFKVLWDNILAGRNFHAIIKNLTKTGKYYWVITDFVTQRNILGEVIGIEAKRRSVEQRVIDEHIAPLYQTLLKLEKLGGMELSSRYFKGFLDRQKKNYPDYVMDILEDNKEALLVSADENIALSDQEISDDIFAELEESAKRKNFFARLFASANLF
ncbi:PAS sensor protein [Capnocytophaga canimorsus]|uniref:PAS sensor protein n=2 Tax=Capnocytophaga canimorsus TaxID=28188 RepID=A0A0B7H329_9FLAO|nr:PAS domain S-box-containing protein [Capnocytophaga canimorsus]CEN32944.1 PAS sensor protein [Capnocytophaga canimorsus]STA71976.1 Aerotaxis receptor [Capnocytophaga canimorsus]